MAQPALFIVDAVATVIVAATTSSAASVHFADELVLDADSWLKDTYHLMYSGTTISGMIVAFGAIS